MVGGKLTRQQLACVTIEQQATQNESVLNPISPKPQLSQTSLHPQSAVDYMTWLLFLHTLQLPCFWNRSVYIHSAKNTFLHVTLIHEYDHYET